uniref:Golgin subfamily A conserved domain-containing protein n=1 Tax=Piliocolobus tephrosceles TaxID=591936 RepID=A0A8C9GL38_9PRIM
IRGCGSRRHCGNWRGCGSWRGCWSWGGKPSMSSGPSHTAASRSWWNNENKSTLQLEQQVKELKKLGAPGSYEPAETAAKAQLSLMALPGEGDGGGHLDSEEEEAPQPMLSILEDLESQEVAFFNFAGARAQEEQRLCCQRLAQQVVSSQKPEAAAPAPGTGGEFVCVETHRALQGAMEKVQLQGRQRAAST